MVQKRCDMYTKAEVLKEIEETKELIDEKSKQNMTRAAGWVTLVDNMFDAFKRDIEDTKLFDKLEPGWIYEIEYNYSEFELKLVHHDVEYDKDDQPQDTIDQVFALVKTMVPYLTTSEYGALYGVGETAVRNWLRRGKLRAAERVGNIWKIPALLTPPRVRGYQRAHYSWDTTLMDISDEFSYLNEFKSITIEQDGFDKKLFKVYLYNAESVKADRIDSIDSNKRERLELMLISNPDVHYNPRADEGVLADISCSM